MNNNPNTQLPQEVITEIESKSLEYSWICPGVMPHIAYHAGATAYATKLLQKEEAVMLLQKTCAKYYAEIGELKRQNDKLKEQAAGWRPLLEDVLREDRTFGAVSKTTIDKLTKFLYGE